MSSPLFTDEGPQYYSAAFRHNARFAKPGPYMTKLNPQQENDFRGWVSSNHVPFDVNAPVQDYDMRGFWLESGGAWSGGHFPDTYKTPYDTTFSAESKYATPDCPFVWHGDNLVDQRNGQLVFGSNPMQGKNIGGQVTPGARIWRGAKGFDTGGGPQNGGTPNVPKYGDPVGDTPSISGGPVSPSEWSEMAPGTKKLAIKTWATNACRAEGVDEKHWVPYLEKVVSFETGASGVAGTGNPNVVNMYDTNAQKNIPSIGLAQVIQDNAPGQNLLDPVTNLRASIRYIKSTYGDVTNVPEAQGIQAGYQTGGRIWRGAKGFDEGGSAGDESILPTQDDIIKEAMEGINERGGITIDLTGHQPSQGYGYAPSKDTELMFEAGKITPEDVDAYIDSHFEDLQKEGMHFGAWVSEEDSAVYLDVSKVGPADAETLRAAMKAEQLGIWDFGAPPELGELRIGRIDDAGKYIPLGQASDLHAEHAREVQRAIESRSTTSTSEVPREPAPEVGLELAKPGPSEPLRVNDYLPEDAPDSLSLYHMTTDERAESILKDGFQPLDVRGAYSDKAWFFTRKELEQAMRDARLDMAERGETQYGTRVLKAEVPYDKTFDRYLSRKSKEGTYTIPFDKLEGVDVNSAGSIWDEKLTGTETLEPGPRVWKDGKSYKVGKDGPGKGGPGAAKPSEKASVPELLGKAGKILGPTLTAANDALMAYGLVDQAAQQGIADQIAKGNVVKKGPSVLGIPTGTAFSDPTFKNQQSFAGRSPADLQYWLKHGRWPEQDKPVTRAGPTIPDNPGMQSGGGLRLHSGFCIRHADGTTTKHTLTQTGPKHYEADGNVKLRPGDTIELDGHRVES